MIKKDEPELCPGGTCEPKKKESIQKISPLQVIIIIAFLGFAALAYQANALGQPVEGRISVSSLAASWNSTDANSSNCTVPDWAIAIGHAEMWKLHNHCT